MPPHGTGLSIMIDGFRDDDDARAFLQFLLPDDASAALTERH